MKTNTKFMAFVAMMGLTGAVYAGNFSINTNLGSFAGGSTDAVKATVDYDGPAGPLPAGVYVIKPRTDGNDWYLPRIVFVESGATLIIEPGTTIYADFSTGALPNDKADDTYGAIVVARGGQIIAEGTATAPIVITSVEERDGLKVGNPNAGQAPVPGRDGGKWGGIVLLGNAPLISRSSNNGTIIRETRIEGFASNLQDTRVLYGPGANPAKPEESSGVLTYMSLRFGGYEFATNSEINGLTMGAVGRGTRIENIEVVSNTDDAFEWFGGTVNCRYLVAAFCNDDNLDMDLGFQGSVQNVLIVQNNTSLGADNALEFSGVTNSATAGTGTDPLDFTKPAVFNVTAIGNGATGSTVLRTNSGFQGQVHNSAFLNYDRGIRIDDDLTRGLVGVNGLRFGSNTFVTPAFPNVNGSPNDVAELALYDGASPLFNNEVGNFAQLFFVGNALPNQNSNSFEPQLAYASPLWKFNSAILSGPENIQDLTTDNQRINVNKLPYQGAFGIANWAACWTYLSEERFFPAEVLDTDGDGISDALETANTALGLNPAVSDAATVLPTLKTTAQFTANFNAGQTSVTSNPTAFSLYTASSIQDLRGTGMMIGPFTPGGPATLSLPLFSSTDLINWTQEGNATRTLTTPVGKNFYRVNISSNAPNPN